MSNHNLTPDQLAIPRPVRREAYKECPETCEVVRAALDTAASEIAAEYGINPEDVVGLEVILSRAFVAIRDNATQPLRTAQMRALQRLYALGQLCSPDPSRPGAEHPFENDLYTTLGTEFGKSRVAIKRRLFVTLFGMTNPATSEDGATPLVARCRTVLLSQGLIPLSQARKIRFFRDEELLVKQGPLQFGAIEEEVFEGLEEYDVESITPCDAPDTDMVNVVFKGGRTAPVPIEAFEIVS